MQAKCRVLITADAVFRGPKLVPLKSIADQAIAICARDGHYVITQIVVEHIRRITAHDPSTLPAVQWTPTIDCKWEEEMEKL